MSVSIVSVCNSALIKVGADRISSITQDTKSAITLNAIFDQVRDEVLRMHPWNFAIKRASLTPSGVIPTFGWDYYFEIPSDCLRILDTSLDEEYGTAKWAKEGSYFAANTDVISIRYIERVVDPSQWDAVFAEALAWRLAMNISYALTQSSSVFQLMEIGFKKAMQEARTYDGMESSGIELVADEWTMARK